MDSRDIRPVEGTLFGSGQGDSEASRSRHRPAGSGGQRPVPPRDQARLTGPRRATLQLMRERVLECTRRCLDLPRSVPGPRFVLAEDERADAFVGRLLSDQNLLASRRAGAVPGPQLRDALARGMVEGLSETLEILCDLDELDAARWELVTEVLNAFHHKLLGAAGDAPSPR